MIQGKTLAQAIISGANHISNKKQMIDELNVFPVPDGDTGTNMSMTIMAAAKEVTALEKSDIKDLAKAISSGSLRGARGNSGVILSQLLRGFTKSIREEKQIDVQGLAAACARARDTAYKAVMKPKEGTILTVASGIAEKAAEMAAETDDLEVFLPAVIEHAEEVLKKTPDMLPVLKQAGVVDSGGQGLVEVLRGAFLVMQGKEIDYKAPSKEKADETRAVTQVNASIEAQANQEISFTYCTQFLVMLKEAFSDSKEQEFKAFLEGIGDSIVVVADDEIVKVHVHTNDPGLAMQRGLSYGSLTAIIIENMELERDEKLSALKEKEMQGAAVEALPPKEVSEEPVKDIGFVAVSIGEGLNEIFYGLGADYIIEGGQTMNPSTEDVLQAVSKVNARTVFIFPNNKNIILAANQAVSLCEDKELIVIPTRTIPQGITALVNYIPGQSAKENEAHMKEEISYVKTGQVTYAIRDTEIDDKEIHQGDYMGIGDKTILSVGTDRKAVAMEMIEEMIDEDSSLISIYYGKEASEEEAMEFSDRLTGKYPDVEVEVNAGGQPIYYYVVSVE